jgi:hypothetical protein
MMRPASVSTLSLGAVRGFQRNGTMLAEFRLIEASVPSLEGYNQLAHKKAVTSSVWLDVTALSLLIRLWPRYVEVSTGSFSAGEMTGAP